MQKEVLLENMTWEEIQDILKETDIAIVPVGSTEEHGPHLPVNNDTFTAFQIAKKTAELAYDDVKALVVPAVPYGLTDLEFPGTITLSRETLISVYKEIAKSLIKSGFRKIIFVNGHGGNIIPLQLAMEEIRAETGALVALVQYWELAYDTIMETLETEGKIFGHACEMETSISWALGQKVRADKRSKAIPPITEVLKDYTQPIFRPKTPIHIGILDPETKKMFSSGEWNGVIGDATLASEEKGRKMLKPVIEAFVEFLKRIKQIKVEVKGEKSI